MSNDETVGELVNQAEALGITNHVDLNGQVWRLQYLGSIQLEQPPADGLPFPQIADADTCGIGDERPCPHGTPAGRYCPQCDA